MLTILVVIWDIEKGAGSGGRGDEGAVQIKSSQGYWKWAGRAETRNRHLAYGKGMKNGALMTKNGRTFAPM